MVAFATGCAVLETAHFGHNIFPGSLAELIADCACLLMGLVGLFLWRQKT